MKKFYPLCLEQMLQGGVDMTGTLKVVAVNSSYTYSDSHQYLSDVVSGDREGTAQTLGSKSYSLGVLGAGNVTYPSVTSGHVVKGLVVYLDSGVEATSKLVCFISENADTTPISVTSTGADIPINWASGVVAKLVGS